jgi:iron complex outermembrane receptor protein
LFGLGLNAVAQAAPGDAPDDAATMAQTEQTKPEEGAENIPVLGEVKVTAQPEEGRAETGYRVETSRDVGPWGDRPIQDTPYSRSVMPSELIENVIAPDSTQLMKMNPVVQMGISSRVLDGANQVNIRGFGNGIAVDGMPTYFTSNSSNVPLEDIERVEVHGGPSTFLFDSNSIGGIVNYVSKAPTTYRLAKLTLGNYGGNQYYLHADLGGPIDAEKRFRYRLNLLRQDGETAVKGNSLHRELYSLALDWNPTDDLRLNVHARRHIYQQDAPPPYWNSAATGYKWVPDSDKAYTQSYAGSDQVIDTYGGKLDWRINDTFSLRANYVENVVESDRKEGSAVRSYLNARDNIRQFILFGGPSYYKNKGGSIYLDAKFDTGPIKHTAVFGYALDDYYSLATPLNSPTFVMYNNLTFDDYKRPEPSRTQPWIIGKRYKQNAATREGLKIGDDIRFNEQWSLLAGASRSRLYQETFSATGSSTSKYDEAKVTPTVSLIYKPKPWLTAYATYIEQFELGTLVGSNYINEGEVFDPYVSKQYELGVKANYREMFLTAALFRIDKMNTFEEETATLPRLTRDGRQIHDGLELTVTGKPFSRLTLMGGYTWLDPYVDKTDNIAIKGKRPTGVAANMFKLYAEYEIPGVPGLFVTGGGYYTSHFYQNSINTVKIPGFTIYDLGARYVTRVAGKDLALRLNIMNVTDEKYWESSVSIGQPRTVAFSATMQF